MKQLHTILLSLFLVFTTATTHAATTRSLHDKVEEEAVLTKEWRGGIRGRRELATKVIPPDPYIVPPDPCKTCKTILPPDPYRPIVPPDPYRPIVPPDPYKPGK
jgi:hypothetical protein